MKDTDYLALSARVRVLENSLLTRERRERMVDARTDEEALKILSECGYPEPENLSLPAVNAMLSKSRQDLFADLRKWSPQEELVEVFQIKYDYHNVKALLKSEAIGEDARRLFMAGGRFEPGQLTEDLRQENMEEYPRTFREALAAAQEVLTQEKSPQKCDLLLDRACYAEMAQAAKDCGSAFLEGYVRLSVDAANLRTAVRCARKGVDSGQIRADLLPGGNVGEDAVAQARREDLPRLFAGELEAAAKLGETLAAPGAGSLTPFERACDDALMAYLAQARRAPFGEQPVAGYLGAREAEAISIRAILSLRKAGLPPEAIRERLRESYV